MLEILSLHPSACSFLSPFLLETLSLHPSPVAVVDLATPLLKTLRFCRKKKRVELNSAILFELSRATCCLGILCYFRITTITLYSWCPGASMLPTMNTSGSGDVVLFERLSPRLAKVCRGDIVIVRSPENPRKFVTKRLIAMENDNLTFLVDPKNSDKSESVVVPKGHVWIQGDNIYDSRDSRIFGPVPYGLVFGKVFWRIWPIEGFGPM